MSYDTIVIGAGINGSSTAYELKQRKNNVLLLEQFPLPHTRGSSHGHTRIIRCMYDQKIYSQMTQDSYPLWKDMEKKVNETLFIQNGLLEIFSPSQAAYRQHTEEVLRSLSVKYQVLPADDINRKFNPLHLSSDFTGLLEIGAGTLMASKCLAAFQQLFKNSGGILRDCEQVINIIPGNICTVITNKGQYTSKSVVIAAGAFSSKLLQMVGLDLPLMIQRTHLCFWKVQDPKEGTLEAGFPSFIIRSYDCYGLASIEYPGLLKLCYHEGNEVDIDYPDASPLLGNVKKMIKECTKGVEDVPSIVEACLYTRTPDRNFVLDVHPKYSNIVIGAGFSGTGFKMSPITGKILACLALGEDPGYDLSTFKINRFPNVVKVKSSL